MPTRRADAVNGWANDPDAIIIQNVDILARQRAWDQGTADDPAHAMLGQTVNNRHLFRRLDPQKPA